MVSSVSFSVKTVLPPGVSTTTINPTSGSSPQQLQLQQQQQYYLQQRQQHQQHQQQQQQQQYRYSSSQQQQQYQQQQHTSYSPQPKLPLSSPRQEQKHLTQHHLQGSRPQSPAPQPPLHHPSQNSQQQQHSPSQQQQQQQQQQQHTTQQHHAQHPAQDRLSSSHRPHSPTQQQQHPSSMHTSDSNNNSHGQGYDPQLRLKPYTLGPSSHTDHWPQHHQPPHHPSNQQHRPSHDSGESYSNNNSQPSGSSNGHLGHHSRHDLPADKDINSSNNNMIHLPVKKEPDSEQGHSRLNMVQKGNKRHLEYRDNRSHLENLDDDRVDQHMGDPDSEHHKHQQHQHQRHHDMTLSSSSSSGYYPQDHHHHPQQQHRGPPSSGGDSAGYHSNSGSYQESMYHHQQQQPSPNHPGGRPHPLSARSLPSLLPRPMDANDGRPGESSRGHPRDEQQGPYGWDEMRHWPAPPPGGRPTVHTDIGSPHFGGHRKNQPPMSAGPHSASMHSPSQSSAPVSAPISAAAAPTPTAPMTTTTTTASSAAPVATTSLSSSSSSASASASTSSSASSSAVLVPAPPGSVVVNNGSSKKRTTPAKHKCPECDKYFTRPFNLKSHQRTHTQERPFVCSFAHCARAFSRLHDCNRHMRTHWRIKPYSCPECHRNFVRQDALTRHLRLDFGHNRCSGYPGPLPGNADQGEKDGDDDEEDMMEDDEDFPDLDAEDQNAGNDSKPTSKSSTKGDPSPTLPSPTSPTTVNIKSKSVSTTGVSEQERDRPLTISTSAANASAVSAAAASSASVTKETHPTPRTSDSTPSKFDKEDQERGGRPDPSSPHGRHAASTTPMSFVHLADRPAALSEGGKEVSGQPHARSYSHSAYNYGPATPLTIQTGNMPMRPTKHLERRATAPVAREGESWMGHAQGQGYVQEPISSPVDEYPRGGPGYGSYRHEMDRPRSATHLPPDYPTSPKDIRRSPGPQSAQGEWHTRSGPPSAHWAWSNPPPSSQDARLRHPTWSSSSSLPPHPQDSSSMQPPHSPVESWSRGHPPPSPHDDPRKSSIRPMSRYGSSPYPIPEHGSGGAERHHRGSSGPMSPAGPMRSSDPYRRSTATAEMDRVGSWNEQRSRSFHGAEGMQDPRSRYESSGSNLPPSSSAMSSGRSPVAAEAASSSSLVSERGHSVSGMVGMERMYPATSVSGGGSFHEREHPSGSIPAPIKTSMAPGGDPNGRDYRPTRSQSMMEYDADRMAAAAMRRSRYAGDPKMVLREERRSMSPPAHRLPAIDTSRPYEGGAPRYPFSAGAERPPSGPGSAMEGGSYSSREEMDEMQARRRDEGGVPGNAGGYYDEHPRSATFQRTPHGY